MKSICEIAEFNNSDGLTPWQVQKLNVNFRNVSSSLASMYQAVDAANRASPNVVSEEEDFTSSTSWFYTGLSITIPAKSLYSVYVEAVYANSPPTGVAIQNYRNNSPADCPYDTVAQGTGHTSVSGYTHQEKRLFVWAKYASAASNVACLDAWHMPAR